MNEKAAIFKPDDIVVTLSNGEDKVDYRLVYDLNCFCELEKIYDSVDTVLKMILGTPSTVLDNVTYMNAPANAEDIKIGDETLVEHITKITSARKAKYADTLNLLWAGCLHDAAIYNKFNEITGYSVTKAKLGSMIAVKDMQAINTKIAIAILRDLLPDAPKNMEAPAETENQEAIEAAAAEQPRLTLRK